MPISKIQGVGVTLNRSSRVASKVNGLKSRVNLTPVSQNQSKMLKDYYGGPLNAPIFKALTGLGAGAVVGAVVGAVAGSFVPIVGTAIGADMGATLGSAIGGTIGALQKKDFDEE